MLNDAVVQNVIIANGATTSGALALPKTYYLAGIMKDTSLDTSTAITFTVSMDGVTYYTLYDDAGNQVSVTCQAATAEALVLDQTLFYPWQYIKAVVADAQTGDTTLQLVLRQY